ncbi:MAG: GNAT family N-acetyltransferase [Chloroflexia bacterium]
MENITVRPLTIENWYAAAELSVLDDQITFVSPNIHSIAVSRFLPDWIPAGICAGDEMVGFVLYGPHEPEEGKKPGWHIMRYMIDKNRQLKGYGKAALKAVIEDIKQHDPKVEFVDLSVAPENARAIHVYETLGFKLTGELHGDEAVMHMDV